MDAIKAVARYMPGVEGVEVGGDWYDVVCPEPDRCVFVVGDVSGRGLKAATTMASLRYATRAYLAQGDSPDVVLARLGRLLDFESENLFATVLIGELDVIEHRMKVASAGHLAPLVISDDEAEFVDMPVAAPVGVDQESRPHPVSLHLSQGSTVIAFTDGLVERRGEHLDVSLERLRTSARRRDATMEAKLDRLARDLMPRGAVDDVVILGVQWRS
jgi:serine phosphatase RsbU (regulator of sigma subunit)